MQENSRVEGNNPIRASDERVDVALHDLGVVHDHDAESHH
eukprot:CAMPEP_0195015410 /NCGR_PEP_ID=MMETSP0326_2-20130528/19612_1 /TAXON_ID=2866 ORGANISM="Crypthecodinium cohnii, Strain Seligo" /NCGR_SAMPLE_ID=MMETSP0326_2 /ASSEMBLY_ACC=CAM_ASM_000348 /LENGTH=39 /DNA_ID= /DNA_START= /DNA_END= /DNA_ORIENTATION=